MQAVLNAIRTGYRLIEPSVFWRLLWCLVYKFILQFRHRLLGKIAARKEQMEENLNIWDFALDSKDMDAIATIDIGHSEIINHYSACMAKALNATKFIKKGMKEL